MFIPLLLFRCFSCAQDFYNYPTCEPCLCNPAGAMPVPGYPLGGCGSFNDGYTLCECKENVEGHICDQCKPGYFDLTKENPEGCKRKLKCGYKMSFNTCNMETSILRNIICKLIT